MQKAIIVKNNSPVSTNRFLKLLRDIKKFLIKYKFLNLLVLPGVIYFFIFKYVPIYGIIIAFKDYNGIGGISGIFNSEWIGFTNFTNFFSSIYFWRILRNTLLISTYKLIWAFPAPILFALLLNELYNQRFKRIVQTISYLPHFLSWVVIAGLVTVILSIDGPVNQVMGMMEMEKINFLSSNVYFRSILVISQIWSSIGWDSIIFLAAISGIPNELYEAAITEGATRWQRAVYITLPSLYFIITILLILTVGNMIEQNFDQIFNLYSSSVYETSDVIDTFVYRRGIIGNEFSYTAAVGLFKSVTSLILILGSNKIVKLLGQEGIW